jgi:inosose dehydratase
LPVKIAYETNSWPEYSLSRAINAIAKVGYEGIEIMSYYDAWRPSIRAAYGSQNKFAAALQKRNLQLISMYWVHNFHDPHRREWILASAKRTAQFLQEFNAPYLTVAPPLIRKAPPTQKQIETMADIFNMVGEITLKHGVQSHFHPRHNAIIENRKEIEAILDLTDPKVFSYCPDTGWIYASGDDPVDMIQTHIKRINFVHFKDAKDRAKRTGRTHFVELGTGKIDHVQIMKILKTANYSGWITLSCDTPTTSPMKSAMLSKKYVEALLS